VKHKSLKMLQ